ncbi:MAG: S1C family serine protease, partial [Lachnospiraceae bacterium]|nr:S1C family serine protease [Lachnospiraceae bacterium]
MPEVQLPEHTKKKEHKAGAGFRKVLASVSFGLCFGLSAGIGVWAVAEGTGLLDKRQPAGTETATYDIPEEIQDALNEINEFRALLKENGATANTVNAGAVTKVNFDVSEMVADAMPAMVSIVNNYVEQVTYFGQPREREGEASGSGIIVGENENEILIATNYHVVEDAKKLMVHFIDDTDVEAIIKGTDEDMDLAIIAVPKTSLSEETQNAISIAKMGDSDSLKLGEPVVAIGNALGYGQSVTNGIVSALNRD